MAASVGNPCVTSNNSMNTARPTLLEMPNVEITRNDIQGTRAGHVCYSKGLCLIFLSCLNSLCMGSVFFSACQFLYLVLHWQP